MSAAVVEGTLRFKLDGCTLESTVKPALSKRLGESQKVVAKDRCLLNTGTFTPIWLLKEPKLWSL